MKKKLLSLSLVVICLAVFATGTLAYFATHKTVHNVISTGGVTIQVEEWQNKNGEIVPYPKDEPLHAMPSNRVSKIATVKNLQAEAYIRAKYEIVVTDSNKKVMNLTQEQLSQVIIPTMNTEDWVRKTDDLEWWYYTKPVAKDDSTEAFFTEILFSGPNMTNEYKGCTVEVKVIAQAVQTANNAPTVKDDVTTVQGWPT